MKPKLFLILLVFLGSFSGSAWWGIRLASLLFSTYRTLSTESDGVAYFSIVPEPPAE